VLRSDANSTLCSCSHLTSFLATIAPQIDPPRFDLITWANLIKYPAGIVMLISYTTAFGFLSLHARKMDKEMDVIGIRRVYETISGVVRAGLRFNPAVDKDADQLHQDRSGVHDPANFAEWLQSLWKFFVVHKLFSIWKRHPCDETSSVDMVWTVYCCFLCSAALGVVFVVGEGDMDPLLLKIRSVVFSTGVSVFIAFVLKWAFKISLLHTRFQKLFIEVCEKKMEELGLDLTRRHQRILPLSTVEKLMLTSKYRLSPLEILAVQSMTSEDDFIRTVDFRYSKYDLLAMHGFALVASHVTEQDFQEEWLNSSYLTYGSVTKVVGYCWIVGLSIFAVACLLAKMLELTVEGTPSQLASFQVGFFVSVAIDLFVMQSVIYFGQDAMCICIKRRKLPRDFPGRSFYGYRFALKRYEEELRGEASSIQMITVTGGSNLIKIDKDC